MIKYKAGDILIDKHAHKPMYEVKNSFTSIYNGQRLVQIRTLNHGDKNGTSVFTEDYLTLNFDIDTNNTFRKYGKERCQALHNL